MVKSDLARELTRSSSKKIDEKISSTNVVIDEVLSKKTGKPQGRYVTIESGAVVEGDASLYPRMAKAIADVLKTLAGDCKRVLTVGLGNRLLTADALGSLVLENLAVMNECGDVVMQTLAPSVVGVTGIESYDVIRGVVDVVRPDAVFAVGQPVRRESGKNRHVVSVVRRRYNARQRSQKRTKTAERTNARRQSRVDRRTDGRVRLHDFARRRRRQPFRRGFRRHA